MFWSDESQYWLAAFLENVIKRETPGGGGRASSSFVYVLITSHGNSPLLSSPFIS